MAQKKGALLRLVVSMTLFGTIGVFVSYIPLDSSLVALARAGGGFCFLLAVMLLSGKKLSVSAIGNNLLWLCLSGAFLGFNWILLFESYRYTSVAVSTLCYYMAPILVVCASPLILKERLTANKLIAVIVALLGMVFISGVLPAGISDGKDIRGILLGLSAAVLYASIMLMNKQLHHISAYDRTVFQLGFSAIILIPYCLMTCDLSSIQMNGTQWLLLAVVAVVHTGFTYYWYFGSMAYLPGQTIAMISYIDPVIAVLCSVFLLNQPLKPLDIPGAVLILGAAVFSELPRKEAAKQQKI